VVGCSGSEHEELDLQIGTDVAVGGKRGDAATRETLALGDERVLHRMLEGAAGLLDERVALAIIVFSTSV
jgi:hypothetical protein